MGGKVLGALTALTALAGTLCLGVALAATAAAGLGAGGSGPGPAAGSEGGQPGGGAPGPDEPGIGAGAGTAIGSIPTAMAVLYRTADTAVCPTMPWQVLAAVGTVESDNGTSTAPGVHSGANYAGAEGVMQFEPATFAEYDQPVPPGGVAPPSPYDATDAVYAAARMLCADGAGAGRVASAVYAYNHSSAYVEDVLTVAVSYGMAVTG